jgi:hypothetical protein
MNILTSSIITDGISIIMELKYNYPEKIMTTILNSYSMHVIHQLNKISLKINNNNLKKEWTTLMMIIVKSQSMSTKMDQLNGCVLNSLSLNKTVKLLESDLLKTSKIKKLTDLKKEIQVPLIQDQNLLV